MSHLPAKHLCRTNNCFKQLIHVLSTCIKYECFTCLSTCLHCMIKYIKLRLCNVILLHTYFNKTEGAFQGASALWYRIGVSKVWWYEWKEICFRAHHRLVTKCVDQNLFDFFFSTHVFLGFFFKYQVLNIPINADNYSLLPNKIAQHSTEYMKMYQPHKNVQFTTKNKIFLTIVQQCMRSCDENI